MTKNKQKGFTLIELLVVIAIIGVLSSVVLASLNTARQKSRDARRIADLKQIQLALELFYDASRSYPTALNTANLVTLGYISTVPTDPLSTTGTPIPYQYAALGAGTTCSSYNIGATLEGGTSHSALTSDADAAAGAICDTSAADFAGTDPIYDLKP